jgi:hypothetical protein
MTIGRRIAAVSTRSLPACRSSPLQLSLESGPTGFARRRFASACVPNDLLQPRSHLSYVGRIFTKAQSPAKAHFRPQASRVTGAVLCHCHIIGMHDGFGPFMNASGVCASVPAARRWTCTGKVRKDALTGQSLALG